MEKFREFNIKDLPQEFSQKLLDEIPENPQFPKVSVILTTCNREYFFTESIESILEQDYPNLEIIVSDDGSQDNTFNIASEYARDNPFIKVVRNARAHGSAGNRNNGLDYATGDLLLLLDDDDLLFKEAISQMIKVYLQFDKQYGIIIANCTRSDDGSFSGKGLDESREISFQEVLSGRLDGEFVTLFERKLLGQRRFNENLQRGNMGLLWLKLHKQRPCYYIHKPLKFYRIHAESLTQSMKYKPLEMVKNYEQDILLFYKERVKCCPDHLARLCATAALLYRQGGNRKKAFKKILQSLAIHPNLLALQVFACLFLPVSCLPKLKIRQRVEK
ncbi:glycosyltransferase family 2 protein [Helicobacter sp. MIT 05-5294]|uniref:glycosyltransferase family 2 protein n=1 Tax=Helicobacter sp. MIT 05-5294 TaxID=1548150 RepID=UPI000A987D42|nr:glycosyltransferase family 2 protein [Helicobacter sp. MIT 05-5294]TLD87222.1 glycosyltransferase family 2 protein [Helicobacter sp. MIT 05-5294]